MQTPKPKLDALPYINTSVPVDRSKEEINKMLRAAGADGIQWTDAWRPARMAEVRFARKQRSYSLSVPLQTADIERQKDLIAPIRLRAEMEKRERAMFSALFYYIESLLKAEKWGLLTFEEAFIGHAQVVLPSGEAVTVAQAMLERHLEPGRALPEHVGSST